MLHRVYRRGGDYFTLWNAFRYFGPTAARFDHHVRDTEGKAHVQDRGVIYAAMDIVTAIAEVFQQKRTVNRFADQPWLVSVSLSCDLSLLDLSDTFAVRAGGSMKLVNGATLYSQNWSRAFYETYPVIHGLYYPSSLTNRPVAVLYERALPLDPVSGPPKFHRALRDALLLEPLRNASREIGYDLL
ncbi:MAG: RES domain-containing protein [Gammaproteobacteria bacterium]